MPQPSGARAEGGEDLDERRAVHRLGNIRLASEGGALLGIVWVVSDGMTATAPIASIPTMPPPTRTPGASREPSRLLPLIQRHLEGRSKE